MAFEVLRWETLRWLGPVAALGIAFPYALAGRHYPWQFAFLVALAVGSLVYTMIRVAETLLLLRASLTEQGPREKAESEQQEEVRETSQRQADQPQGHPGGERGSAQIQTDSEGR